MQMALLTAVDCTSQGIVCMLSAAFFIIDNLGLQTPA